MIQRRRERWVIAVLSLLFTYLFFAEYLRPIRAVYIPYDLYGYHYPLNDYAFQALKSGRFPQWDPTNYSGMPFAANINVALFYPPTWAMYLANANKRVLSFFSLEELEIFHFWLAFFLCYLWLRRRLSLFASTFGAATYAFGGYMLYEIQHLGEVMALAWLPLGFQAVDEIAEGKTRAAWKVAAVSALTFVAGYSPTTLVVAVAIFGYALFRREAVRTVLWTGTALAYSVLLVAVQLLPTVSLSSMRVPEARYGSGIQEASFFLSYIVPNFHDFSMKAPINTDPVNAFYYFYFGAAGIAGILLWIRYLPALRKERAWVGGALLGSLGIAFIMLTNPGDLIWKVVSRSETLSQLCRAYYFMGAFGVCLAPLAAIGIDRFLAGRNNKIPKWIAPALIVATIAWSAWLWSAWVRQNIWTGPASLIDSSISIVLFLAALFAFRGSEKATRTWLAAILILLVFTDFKVHGTSTRFSAGTAIDRWEPGEFPWVDKSASSRLYADPVYRVVVGDLSPNPSDLRHVNLSTPQGFEAFITKDYKALIERIGKFRTNWLFDVDPANDEALAILGVKFYLTPAQAEIYPKVKASPRFTVLEPPETFQKVFELKDPQPPFGWDTPDHGTVEKLAWEPEHRTFKVRSTLGGHFHLSEQWNPGWKIRIDGAETPVHRWPFDPEHGAFQAAQVPPGEHHIQFDYSDPWLMPGAVITLISLAGLIVFARTERTPKPSPAA